MFARTERLLLRPGWVEDAPALFAAIADEARNLAGAPWPYALADAAAQLAAPRDPALPSLLIFARGDSAPQLVGSCGLDRRPSGAVEFGFWIARSFRGRGFAVEAGDALIAIARTLGLARLDASHFVDNPSSGRVLEKLGFRATGLSAPRFSPARGGDAPTRLFRLELRGGNLAPDEGAQLAA